MSILKRTNQAREAENAAIEAAREMINTEVFIKYKDQCEKLRNVLIGEMKVVPFDDPVRYGCIMFDYINRIKNNEMLLKAVESKARV